MAGSGGDFFVPLVPMDFDLDVKGSRFLPDEKVENSTNVSADTLLVISTTTRQVFFGVYVVISAASLLGNVAVIFTIWKRKYRFVQKTCIISLALSDLLSTIAIATNNLETFSHPLIDWTMGPFLCHLIPMLQFSGIMASSVALVFIAMDRYRNIVHALSNRWNPNPLLCIFVTIAFWIMSLATSFPMYTFFRYAPVRIVYIVYNDQGIPINATSYWSHICATFEKSNVATYYITMTVIMFLPLLVIFVWFYYNIASLIWKHRKPLSTMFNKKIAKSPELDSSSSHNHTSKTPIDTASKTDPTQQTQQFKTIVAKSKNVSVERKIRTFKIIVTLMIVFIVCRLPYYVFFVLKLTNEYKGEGLFILNYSFIALNILNCVLNPLLYTFLNQTLKICARMRKAIHNFTCEICCFCFSHNDFEAFEKDNPFLVENLNEKMYKDGKDTASSRKRNSRVKFEEYKHCAQKSNQDTNTNMSGASSQQPLKY